MAGLNTGYFTFPLVFSKKNTPFEGLLVVAATRSWSPSPS